MSPLRGTEIGRFEVAADPAEVAAFRAATGLADGEGDAQAVRTLPATFPIRWLVTPQVRSALEGLVSDPTLVLVHESQSFDYARPLAAGAAYTLALAARRETTPDRLIVEGTIAAADGAVHATVETILRLFSTEAVAA